MSDVDEQIARARAAMERIAEGHRGGDGRTRQRRVQAVGRKLTSIAVVDGGILFIALMIGLAGYPIGIMGVFLTALLLLVATLALTLWPAERAPSVERLVQTDLKTLPAQTERWLAAQRPRLPAPAATLIDRIGQRLDTLSPQLARVGDDDPAAGEVRKLIAEQLPAFVNDYGRIPRELRQVDRGGRTPDMELVDGLKLIEQEIGDMTARLAASDLDQLQTRGRFLEMKYRDERASG